MTDIIVKEYSAGWSCHDKGTTDHQKALRKNPHRPWSQEWISWNRGWNEAKDSSQESFNIW